MRGRAQRLLERSGQPEAMSARDRELPESFQEQIRSAAAAAAPATEAITVAGGGARMDVAFLALHGPYGEDGTLQGMLDLLGIPYVGSGTLASALAMDKAMAKKVFLAEGIPVPAGTVIERGEFRRDPERAARRACEAAMPAVVKPSRQGSSIGMSMVKEPSAMERAPRTRSSPPASPTRWRGRYRSWPCAPTARSAAGTSRAWTSCRRREARWCWR
jgi:D-alanine--D-alanine ligase